MRTCSPLSPTILSTTPAHAVSGGAAGTLARACARNTAATRPGAHLVSSTSYSRSPGMMSPPLAAGPSGSMAVTRSAPAAGCRVSPIPVRGGILVVGLAPPGLLQGAAAGSGRPARAHTRGTGERLPGAYWVIELPAADPFPSPLPDPRAPASLRHVACVRSGLFEPVSL